MHPVQSDLQHLLKHDSEGESLFILLYYYIFKNDVFRLKKEYSVHLKTLGSTGAGLDPEAVTPGSELANLVGTSFLFRVFIAILTPHKESIVFEWPWWKEFHSFWRELPNYNPVAVENSTPGTDHAAAAAILFEPLTADTMGEPDITFDDDKDGDGADSGDEVAEGDDGDDREQVHQDNEIDERDERDEDNKETMVRGMMIYS